MADLTARFSMLDNMSAQMERIAETGARMTSIWESSQSAANNAMTALSHSAEGISNAFDIAENHSAALREALDKCDESSKALGDALVNTEEAYTSYNEAAEKAQETLEKLSSQRGADSSTRELTDAMENAKQAFEEFQQSEREAEQAMDEFDRVMISGTNDLSEIEAAQRKCAEAAENLTKAQKNSAEATDELSDATKKAGDNGEDMLKKLMDTAAFTWILNKVKELAAEVYNLATAFSDAESTVVTATGATGAALDGLTNSMMDAYAASKTGSLSDAAAAVGEINTRMHLTGAELTDTTEKFLDFADITGSNVVTSVQNVTKIMNKWGGESRSAVNVMDKLSYAAQISGASVDDLSSAVITGAATYQSMGLSLDNTISMLADFELAGINSSSAMMGLRQAVSKFTTEGRDANEALLEVVDSIANAADETEATSIAVETFGTRAGQELALAIRNGTLSVDTFNSTLDEAQGTLEKTAKAAQTLDEKWEQANNNISAAFTKAVEPTFEKLSSWLAGIVNGIGDFLNANEALTKILVSLGTAIGVVVAAIAGFSIIKAIIPLLKELALAATEALGPVGLVIIGVGALGAGVATAIALFNDGSDAMAGYTETTRAQYDELQQLNSEYENACEVYGETSAEAILLKRQVDEATEAFENQKRTLDDFYSSIDEVCSAHEKLAQEYYESQAGIVNQQSSSEALTRRLKELATSSEKTAGSQEKMKAIVAELNEMFPNLGLGIEDATNDINGFVEAVDNATGADTIQNKYDEAKAYYAQLLAEQEQLEAAKNAAQDELTYASKKYSEKYSGWGAIGGTFETLGANWFGADNTVKRYQDAQEAYDRATSDWDENQRLIADCEATLESYGETLSGTGDDTVSAADAMSVAFSKVEDKTKALVESYKEAYDSAYQSISGQMGLFEQMAISCETSTDEMIAALKSQSEYMSAYTGNLKSAAEYGISEGLIASLSDGSKESAGYLDAIISKIEEMGVGSDEAQAFINELNGSFADVEEGKNAFANTVAEMETDFSNNMESILDDMETAVGEMNFEDGAAEAAQKTIDAYVKAIKEGAADAEDAAAFVSSAASGALKTGTTSKPLPFAMINRDAYENVPGYASGTTNSPDVFIAGEEGPELIVGAGGSTVFPSGETDRIINAIQRPLCVEAPDRHYDSVTPESYRRIALDITGAGTIMLDKGADKETVLGILTENIKPVLMDIINNEIYEEGEGVYEY